MKNIILLGVPRAGKTTFAKMILKEFPNYNLIEEDTIFQAYLDTLHELMIERKEEKIKVDDVLGRRLAEKIFDYQMYFAKDRRFIFETVTLPVEKALSYRKKNTIIIYLGIPSVSLEEGMRNVRNHDTTDDWTYYENDYMLKMYMDSSITESKKDKKKCEKYHVKYVDTSFNRKKVLDDLMTWLKEEME